MAKRKPKSVPPCRPVKGMPATTKVPDNRLRGGDRAKCRLAAEYIDEGIDWALTAEGYDFWNAVHDRLVEISEGAQLK